jgi:uncharacterized membrane protein
VIAVIITIMVLELKVPRGAQLDDLLELVPVFFSYVLSYLYVGIYWNNHHHMLHTIQRVTGGILWANLHFLFWLSLVPFTTGWMAENHFATWPTFAYGLVLLLSALSYSLLQACVIRTTAPIRCWPGRWALILRARCLRCCTWPRSRWDSCQLGWRSRSTWWWR